MTSVHSSPAKLRPFVRPFVYPILASLALLACRPPSSQLPVCPAFVASGRAHEADTRMLPPDVWFQVLVPGVTRPALEVPDAPRDCSGVLTEVKWSDPAAASADPRLAAKRLPARKVSERDLTFGEGPDGQLLVWARVEHFDDGSARGPVALVRWVERGLEVRGVGTLWASPRRARLRLEPLGEDQLLVADGERCTGDDPSTCKHEIYLMPLIDQRFQQAGMTEEGVAAGPARVTTFEHSDIPLKDGWVRRADIQRHLRLSGPQATISEDIRIRECDPSAQPETCQEQLVARDERPLQWKDGKFTTTRSAWAQVATP